MSLRSGGEIWCVGSCRPADELGFEDGEAEAMEGAEWSDIIDEHQRQAVEGAEPGGLVIRPKVLQGKGIEAIKCFFSVIWQLQMSK